MPYGLGQVPYAPVTASRRVDGGNDGNDDGKAGEDGAEDDLFIAGEAFIAVASGIRGGVGRAGGRGVG